VETGELRLQQAVAEGQLPGAAILLAEASAIRLKRFFGRYHEDTRLPIAGASQWLSAAIVLGQVSAGTLDLDDPLIRFFPQINDRKAAVSVRQLLAHTSGLASSHPCLGERSTTLAACAEAILETSLLADPGTEVRYGESSYQVAGRIAEIVSGKSWKVLFEEHLKNPLKLHRTSYGKSSNPRIASGVRTTSRDLGTFLQSFLEDSDRSLATSTREAMLSPQQSAAKVAYSPFPEDWRPGLGPWITEDGGAWLHGLLGTVSWISSDRSEAGLFMTIAEPQVAAGLWSEMLPRRIVPAARKR